MAIRCPICGAEYDVTLFEFGKTVRCSCGRLVRYEHLQVRALWEEQRIREIKTIADRISFLIVHTDCTESEIELEKRKLKETITRFFPEKAYLYELIYEPRFQRLKEQFRGETRFD